MINYHVMFYYSATGMEGKPLKEDFGYIEANSVDEAREKVCQAMINAGGLKPENKEWFKGCLSARAHK